MKLSSLLDPNLICIKPKVDTKEQAIDLLIQKLYRHYAFELDRAEMEKKVAERENLGGTSFPTGIAVPHARLENFKDLIVGIIIPETPIKTEAKPIRMLVLILTDKSSSTLYLNTLAAFVKISKDEGNFLRLVDAGTPQDFIDTLKGFDINIKKELTVADIMTKDLVTVKPETNLKELADIFYIRKFSYAPVLDAAERFIGEVNIRDMLRLGIPNYATMVGSLNFLSTFEPLEELLKNEDKLLVSQIMKKPSIQFSPDTSIIEAVLEISQNKRRHIPVVENGKIIGIISVMDILNKVIRG